MDSRFIVGEGTGDGSLEAEEAGEGIEESGKQKSSRQKIQITNKRVDCDIGVWFVSQQFMTLLDRRTVGVIEEEG